MLPAPLAEICTARARPRHEDSEHCGNRISSMTKDQCEGLGPCDLVDEARRSGEEKTGQNTSELGRRYRLFSNPPTRHRSSKALIIAQRTMVALEAGRSTQREEDSVGAGSGDTRDR